jgi:glutamyl-tRNA reductase
MNLVLVGLSHQTAPVEVREQAFIPESAVGECVQRLIDRDLVESGFLLSTCNRTELYALTAGDGSRDQLLESFGLWPHKLDFGKWRRCAYTLADGEALIHLFRVAAGLESMIVGESQILGQLKECLALAQRAGSMNPRLRVIVHGAIRAGKRVHHETELGRRAVSVSHAAVAIAQEMLGQLSDRGVLLVGAGAMGRGTLGLLRNKGIRSLYLASRTLEKAGPIGDELGAHAIDLGAVDRIIDDIDLIISCTSATGYVFDPSQVRRLQARRRQRQLTMIDMAVPRDIDPQVSAIPGVRLVNIDDLQSVAGNNLVERQAAAPAAERIIEEEFARTSRALALRDSAELVSDLVRHAERVRDRELERHLHRLPAGDLRSRNAMTALAHALTGKFLHGPIRALQESPNPELEASVFLAALDRTSGPSLPD